ncbi:MAG: dTDP-4-dehydrorhamnose reductase [Hyphomicrobiales bacterium]
MTKNLSILVTGADGQLGAHFCALARTRNAEVHGFGRKQLDVSDEAKVSQAIEELRPDVVVNAAAYTNVDGAENDREGAYQVNRNGPAHLARACAKTSARLIHISTDFVFDGETGQPYRPFDTPNPINVYGQSKLAGEREILGLLPSSSAIIRTSWLYAPERRNFVTVMLEKLSNEAELSVVCDHISTPTSTESLCQAILAAIEHSASGTFHWADCGIASRYDFACAIYEYARACGLISNECNIIPIGSEAFETVAPRPGFTALDSQASRDAFALPAIHWRERLLAVIQPRE